jgi:CBS domain-containing protein
MSTVSTSPASDAKGSQRVADAMHWGLVSCDADATLESVASLMSTERVHCVVVFENRADASPLWGVVTDLDLIAAAGVRPLDEQQAGGTAMRPGVTIDPSESLVAAARLMTREGVAHLVVVDSVERRPVGVLSTLDVARALASG